MIVFLKLYTNEQTLSLSLTKLTPHARVSSLGRDGKIDPHAGKTSCVSSILVDSTSMLTDIRV